MSKRERVSLQCMPALSYMQDARPSYVACAQEASGSLKPSLVTRETSARCGPGCSQDAGHNPLHGCMNRGLVEWFNVLMITIEGSSDPF